ncbi:hypothetical protein Sgou_25090 [Streptomyces gougerotii]|uniref:Uncharacterized protein n=1 Tax=Streptomyces gougerotii TaxID=53448 RepID=A0ABQ1D5K7_9ACTN|nr:hypothetical protein Sgou_25090 [Streptomyces gougerotii]
MNPGGGLTKATDKGFEDQVPPGHRPYKDEALGNPDGAPLVSGWRPIWFDSAFKALPDRLSGARGDAR